jgi:hypothetical protein
MRVSERGQVAPLIAVMVVAAGFLCVVVVRFGVAASARATARTSADAVALAGAAEGQGKASEIAGANRSGIVTYEPSGRDVKVRVRFADAEATAKARNDGVDGRGLASAMRAVLARAGQLLGEEVRVIAVREQGLGVDVDRAQLERVRGVASQAGLCQPDASARPAYFEVCPPPSGGSV